MRVRGRGAEIHGEAGSTPPLPFITVDDAEGAKLVALGVAIDIDAEPESSDDGVVTITEPKTEDLDNDVVLAPAPDPDDQSSDDQSSDGGSDESGVATPDSKLREIADAIEILDDADFNKDGSPKLKSLEAILGFDVTEEDVAAALELPPAE